MHPHPPTLRSDLPTPNRAASRRPSQHLSAIAPGPAGLHLQRAEVLKYCAPPPDTYGAPGVIDVRLVAPASWFRPQASGAARAGVRLAGFGAHALALGDASLDDNPSSIAALGDSSFNAAT